MKISEATDRLRGDFLGWDISYEENAEVPCTATRQPGTDWSGGSLVLRAPDLAALEFLINEAIRLEAKVAGGAGRPQTPEPVTDAEALVGDDELRRLRDESRSLVSDRALRGLASDTPQP